LAEEDHRPDEFIDPLPVGADAELELAPFVGRLDPLASCRHPPSPHRRRAALPASLERRRATTQAVAP
jgi:hypothetical protein